MGYGVREVDTKKSKILKLIAGIIGGTVCLGTLGLGIFVASGVSLPIVSILILCGILPAEVILTTSMVKNTQVETLSEELVEEFHISGNQLIKRSFYALEDEITDGPYEEVVAERINGVWVYDDPSVKEAINNRTSPIQFTPIKPVERIEEEVTNGFVKKRVIEFNPNKKG